MPQRADAIIGYAADADIYCPDCARKYFKTIHGWKYSLAAALRSARRTRHPRNHQGPQKATKPA